MPASHAKPAAIPSSTNEAVEIIGGDLATGLLILADHAMRVVPRDLGDLGLPMEQFERHIAYDIGIEPVIRALAAAFGAPAVLSRFSRLVIDPNRGADDPTLVMRIADGALIPGNARLNAGEIAARIDRFYAPYHGAIASLIDAAQVAGVTPAIVSLHSFTPVMKGRPRPWHVGVLWDADPRLPIPFMDAMRSDPAIVVGDNEPYDGALPGDTIDQHATARGLANILIELRQDLIDTPGTAAAWAKRLAGPLQSSLARPDIHQARMHPSRTRDRIRPQRA
jgi:predicted N-formylglutamate amidohydrolase